MLPLVFYVFNIGDCVHNDILRLNYNILSW